MNISATVAGYESTWRFRHSRRLDAWLSDQPWRGRGGVIAVRIASVAQASATIAALARAARAADEFGDVRVIPLPSEDLPRGLRSAIARALELPDSLGRAEAARRVAEELHHPHLFVAEPAKGVEVARVFDEAAGVCDEVTRISPASAATVVMLELPAHPVSGDSLDLSVGSPADGLLGHLNDPEVELWRAYVHARLAWEVAGDLSRAEEAEPLGFAELGVGDDDKLEQLLNRFAGSCLEALDDAARRLSDRYIEAVARTPREAACLPARGEMEASGLFWRPVGEPLPRPAPWWARVILSRRHAGAMRYLLRSCLICAPIAREILLRCFDLEAHDRASCSPRHHANSDAELRRKFDSFLRGDPDSEYRHYPKSCPAEPCEPTDFASYGAILSFLPSEPARESARHRLRRLRNAVAHGHYVSWSTLLEIREVGATLT